jgi:hypothetical protein
MKIYLARISYMDDFTPSYSEDTTKEEILYVGTCKETAQNKIDDPKFDDYYHLHRFIDVWEDGELIGTWSY